MPPKSKGSSKKPAKARTPTLINGLTKEEMSKEQMEEHIVSLREELDREREERNYFQLERDKIHTFWEIKDRELEEIKAECKNLDKEIEEDEGRHQVEIKVYKQKMKHLLCEHQNTICELKADGELSIQVLQKEQQQLESQLHNDMKAKMVDIQELDIENLIKELELKHKEKMTEARNSWEKQLTERTAKCEERTELLTQEQVNMTKYATSEREHFLSSHINDLTEVHNNALSDAKAFIDAIQDDLDVNDDLKYRRKAVHDKLQEIKKDLACRLEENKKLALDVKEVEEENAIAEKKMKHFTPEKDMKEKVLRKKLNDLKSDHETLELKFSELQLQRDELYKSFPQNIQKVQHLAGMKNTLLGRKLQGLTDGLENTQAQLSSVLSASNVDQTALSGITKKLEENFDFSNNSIKNLQYKRAQISQARKELLLTYEAQQ
ncbi:dynein regulatory complex subunit 4-like [Centropristis striata]|uniref:dynein regulatory complex subunit 4-like n=1 Tax=Centropristis striata TaxID=184440 RepID=UPI0027E06226|nr:dynein regulatory complex subunit 4-like [Centropristis striata]